VVFFDRGFQLKYRSQTIPEDKHFRAFSQHRASKLTSFKDKPLAKRVVFARLSWRTEAEKNAQQVIAQED
jgi:hypothetical protein